MLKLLFYISLGTLSLGQFANLFKDSGFNVYIFDIIIAVFFILGLGYFLTKKSLTVPKSYLLYILFIFWSLITLLQPLFVMNTVDFIVSLFYLVRLGLYLGVGIVLFNMLKADQIGFDEVLNAIVISGIFISLAGFIQLILLPDFETLDPALGWDPHKNRLASTFFDPNFTGGYLVLCLCIVMYRFFVQKIRNKLTYSSGTVLLIALFLTFSRSSWAAFAVVVLVFGLLKSKWLLVFAAILAFSAYFAVPRVQTRLSGITDPADSAHFRLISWGNALSIAQDNLLLGTGYNTFRYAQVDYGFVEPGTIGGNSGAGSDSSFLLILATTGIIGFVIYLFAYFTPLFAIYKLNSRHGILIIAVFLSIFVQSQFINAIFFPQIMFLWIILLTALSNVLNA